MRRWWALLGFLLTVFDAGAAMAPAGVSLQTQAVATYTLPGAGVVETIRSNVLVLQVSAVDDFALQGDAWVSRTPGSQATMPYRLSNLGNRVLEITTTVVNANNCSLFPDTHDLGNLRVVVDANTNGIADPAELTASTQVSLQPGTSASVLVLGDVPQASTDGACIQLTAASSSPSLSRSISTFVSMANNPAIALHKQASAAGPLKPGGNDTVRYTLTATNQGTRDATPSNVSTSGQSITVNGNPTSVILLRDEIPTGAMFQMGSLQVSHASALLLFRKQGDPAFAYRTQDQGSANIEVAAAFPFSLGSGQAVSMSFDASALASAETAITNVAEVQHAGVVGANAMASVRSNASSTPVASQRLGLAHAVISSKVNTVVTTDPSTNKTTSTPDKTVTFKLGLRVRNDGNAPLFNLQLPHQMGGAALAGNYTTAAVPPSGMYTVVPGSLKVAESIHSSTKAIINQNFTGDGNQTHLLIPGANGSVLPIGGEFTLTYEVRINTSGRNGATVLSQITGQASLYAQSVLPDATDVSTNGLNPDPDGDFNPNNNSVPTPLLLTNVDALQRLSAGLTISKAVDKPVRLASGEYDITYTVTVANTSDVQIPNVRVVDNLACNLNPNDPATNVSSWRLVKPPVAKRGLLPVSSAYTGDAPCDNSQTTDPGKAPIDPRVIINDSSKTLPPGASEEYTFTVRVNQTTPGWQTQVPNKAWLVALQDNQLVDPNVLVTSASVSSLLVDPQGHVYDSITRQPIPGALLTLRRLSCDGGIVTKIDPTEVVGSSGYTFNADGSVSMLTGADGQYQFFWQIPPVADVCNYSLSVTPPATHTASKTIPSQTGVYGGCGFVVPHMEIPSGSQATTWYKDIRTGYKASANPAVCPVLHNHIPLDPVSQGTSLLLSKQTSKSQAEMGDQVDFELVLSNRTGAAIGNIHFDDVLPAGFTYVKGTAMVDGTAIAEPVQQFNKTTRRTSLSFSAGSANLADKGEMRLRYRLRIGVGVMNDSDAVNSAVASGLSSSAALRLSSNVAQAKLRVSGGVFSNQGFAIGKVWADCNRNGTQEDPEPGVPGVRLYLENGNSVITDAFGRWSLYGLKPVTHVLRVDPSTLPKGSVLSVLSNRQSGEAHSRFLDVKNGELVRADFAIKGCEGPGLKADIDRRKTAQTKNVDEQLQALVTARLAIESRLVGTPDTRGLPASGMVGGNTGVLNDSVSQPLLRMPQGMGQGLGPSGNPPPATDTKAKVLTPEDLALLKTSRLNDPLLNRLVTFSTEPLEQVMDNLPAVTGFIELQDGDAVATEQINVRVSGPPQSSLRLQLNGSLVPDNRIGKKAMVPSTGLIAQEYIGVRLKAGVNELELQAMDEFGNVRQRVKIKVKAPGALARMRLTPVGRLAADPLRPAQIKLQLTDSAGIPIMARTAVSLNAQGARWLNTDTQADEPGVQIYVEGGETTLLIEPPGQQALVPVRLQAGAVSHSENLNFLPSLMPLQGVGVVEGVLDLSRRGSIGLNQPSAANAFEKELNSLSSSTSSKKGSGRTAFFFKGTISGEYLLTAAFDSDKTTKEQLMRDVRPDDFYPVYGDSSLRGYDAQSAGRLYVRIDKDRSFLLLGDFNTASSGEVRQLSQYSRALSGLQHRYEDESLRITSFVASTTATQQVEELPVNGLSFYNLSTVLGDIRAGSDKVELIVRDRSQPEIVLLRRTLTRMTDYSFEPITRSLQLVQALPSLDSNLNPQSLRVTYELEAGGNSYQVAGTDVQVKVADSIQLGTAAVKDQNPLNERELKAVTSLVRLGDHTALSAEVVQSRSDEKGSGGAARVTLRHEGTDFKAQTQWVQTDKDFDNLSATTGAGRAEVTANAEYALNANNRLRAEGYVSRDKLAADPASSERSNTGIAYQHQFNASVSAEAGLRHGNSASNPSNGFAYSQVGNTASVGNASISNINSSVTASTQTPTASTSARARLSLKPRNWPRLQAFVEAEQDLDIKDHNALTLGGSFGLTDKTRLYAQRALVNHMDSLATINGQSLSQYNMIGVDSAYMEGGRLFNEYRAPTTGYAQNATGVRNTFKLSEQWRMNASLEHIESLGRRGNTTATPSTATAAAVGLDWGNGPWRMSSALENRNATTNHASLASLAVAKRVDNDMTLLARSMRTSNQDLTNSAHTKQLRQQVGMAYRPARADRWNILSRYEYRLQDISLGTGNSQDPFRATMANNNLGLSTTHIVSTHANWQVDRGQQLSLHHAAKTTRLQDAATPSAYWAHMLHARYTVDLSNDWDLGLQMGQLWGKDGVRQSTLGLETGYQVVPSVWVSAGYNLLGLQDADLAGQNYTSRGSYMRLRWKFDETAMQFGKVADDPAPPFVMAVTAPAAVVSASATPVPVPVTEAVASAKPVVDPYASAKAEVSERVMMWALALSAKNLEQYTAFYAPLAGTNKTLRRDMQRPRIQMRQGVPVDVQIDDLALIPQSDGSVVTRFKQRAQSKGRRTAVLKQLRWRKFDAGWLITHESNG